MVNRISNALTQLRRGRTPVSQLFDVAELGMTAARIGLQTGLAHELRAPALGALLRQRLRGKLGLGSVYRVHAASRPETVALVCSGRRITYRELDTRIDRLATHLRHEQRLGRGSSAVLMMHNRAELVETQAALARIGASVVSASWRSTPDELEYLVSHSGASTILVEAELADVVLAARPRLSRVGPGAIIAVGGTRPELRSYDEIVERGPIDVVDADGEDSAVVIYTSGTTGKPKGAVRRFASEQMLGFAQMVAELPLRTDDRHLAVCPLYHSTAFAFTSLTLVLGGTVVIEPKFDAERALARIAEERITTSAMVPTMLARILALPAEVRRRYDTRSLRAVLSGGAPLSGALARAFIEEHGHVLFNFYGATETGINTLATPDELVRSPGTIGHVVPGNEIRLLDDAGHEVPPGRTGELFVRNTMLVSYHRDDDATRASMRDGFFSVGDLAHVDANGLFHIDGRKRDMIISGGVNVYPAEIEEVLHTHPAIAEVAVVGAPDADLGERVRACVVLRPSMELDVAEVTAFCRARLSGPKIPREWRVMDELPKNPTGKVLKRELR